MNSTAASPAISCDVWPAALLVSESLGDYFDLRSPSAVSFDHLVGKCRQHRRYLEAKCPRGFEVKDEFELDRLVDRQIARLVTFEDSAGINADLAISICKAYAITYQPTRNNVVAKLIDGRQSELRGQRYNAIASRVEEWIGGNEQRGCVALSEACER